MAEVLKEKARNYFLIALLAEKMGMRAESGSNYFKALFAVDDLALQEKLKHAPNDHNERFEMLKAHIPALYDITDRLFSTYRRTYTRELSREELEIVREKVTEAFKNGAIDIPTEEEAFKRIAELAKKRKAAC
ncbi:MAG TPA: hypothetical protein HA362_02315 [Nanoarchaeota archaeon]|nr:hypothetical protein [Nanoarchaeota archaeon]